MTEEAPRPTSDEGITETDEDSALLSEEGITWLHCKVEGCRGVQVRRGKCFIHNSRRVQLMLLSRLAGGGELTFLRGAELTPLLLQEVLNAAPRDSDGKAELRSASFRQTTFLGEADFMKTVFKGAANFGEAAFKEEAVFHSATFLHRATFSASHFEDEVDFTACQFHAWASFTEVEFHRGGDFGGTTFGKGADFTAVELKGGTSFDGSTFYGPAEYVQATFHSGTDFSQAGFFKGADFGGAAFRGECHFSGATFDGNAGFSLATFEDHAVLGPMVVAGELRLNDASFARPAELEVAAWRLSCLRTRFSAGGRIRLAWSEFTLEEAEFLAPFIISEHSSLVTADSPQSVWRDYAIEPPPIPSLVSLRRSNALGLVLTGIDLRECRFAGAHNLDRLRIEAPATFFTTAKLGTQAARQVIAEECEWRRTQGMAKNWPQLSNSFRPSYLGQERSLEPKAIASLYRLLRKGREDNKDEPGAADFYYGEMEMRRQATSLFSVERFILGLTARPSARRPETT